MEDSSATTASADFRLNILHNLPALRRFAYRFARSDTDREDLVQETIMRALRSEHSYTPGTALKSWLFTIMRNTFCTEYKRRQREPVGLAPERVDGRVDAPQEWAVRQAELMAALATVAPQTRQALVLVAMGTSYSETAQVCACEIGTVKSRVNRARKALEARLGAGAAQ